MTRAQSKLTAVSLFSGCGGFDLGAQRAGATIVWANEIEPNAARAYRALVPGVHLEEGDVGDVDKFPAADALIGCYPCTGFSLAARRRWHGRRKRRNLRNDTGNYLYFEFLRALRQVEPKYFFVENVRGMVTASDGWFFERQLENFRRCGYRVKWSLLNAADYGVPQARSRIFIVGVRRDIAREFRYSFPTPTHGMGLAPYVSQRTTIGGDEWPVWPKGEFHAGQFHGHYLTRNRKRPWDAPSFAVVANSNHVPLHPSGKPMRCVSIDDWRLQGQRNRRLSWKECAAFQELPHDKLTDALDCTLDWKYRVVGNAVPPRLSAAILAPVVAFEESKERG